MTAEQIQRGRTQPNGLGSPTVVDELLGIFDKSRPPP